MAHPVPPARHVRFGPFRVDLRSGELYQGSTRLKVPDQSIEILKALLDARGDLVTRDELRQRLWADDTFVDFEHSLNAAVRRLREALGDSAETPRFIDSQVRFTSTNLRPSATARDASRLQAGERLRSSPSGRS